MNIKSYLLKNYLFLIPICVFFFFIQKFTLYSHQTSCLAV